MRITSNQGTEKIEWTEGGEFPDRDDCVRAIVNPEDMIPNLVQPPDSIATLPEWIGWMEKSVADRRRDDDLNTDEKWCVTGIEFQKYGVHEEKEDLVPIFNQFHPPSDTDIKSGDGFIFRKSVPFDEVNTVMGLTGEIVDAARDAKVRVDIDYYSQDNHWDYFTEGDHEVAAD